MSSETTSGEGRGGKRSGRADEEGGKYKLHIGDYIVVVGEVAIYLPSV